MATVISVLNMIKIACIVGGLAISAFGIYNLAIHWEDGGSQRTKAFGSIVMGGLLACGVGGIFTAIVAQLNSLPQ